jgi:Tol biopolymer transport system component
VSPDTNNPRLLTSQQDSSPKFSPDCSMLGFISKRNGETPQVFLSKPDGSDARALTDIEGGVLGFGGAPACDNLLFTATINVDSSLKGERGPAGSGSRPHVVWRLPYKAEGTVYILDREVHLFVIDATSAEAQKMTDGPFNVGSARFSRDGDRIAYTGTRMGREAHRSDAWMMHADGTDKVPISQSIASVQVPV